MGDYSEYVKKGKYSTEGSGILLFKLYMHLVERDRRSGSICGVVRQIPCIDRYQPKPNHHVSTTAPQQPRNHQRPGRNQTRQSCRPGPDALAADRHPLVPPAGGVQVSFFYGSVLINTDKNNARERIFSKVIQVVPSNL